MVYTKPRSLLFSSILLVFGMGMDGNARADDMDFYYGRTASTEISSTKLAKDAEVAAEIEPAAGPKCPKLSKNPCGPDNATVYKTDKNGCQMVLRCGKAVIW